MLAGLWHRTPAPDSGAVVGPDVRRFINLLACLRQEVDCPSLLNSQGLRNGFAGFTRIDSS